MQETAMTIAGKYRTGLLVPLVVSACLGLSACQKQERASGDVGRQDQEQTGSVKQATPPADVETDRSPNPQTGTGGDIPKQAD
ncbi:MAG: hypothetical protein BGN94_04350 [Rhizobiales bacterium 68-8]|nr:MAG: hypothetical protein BGN94_04350 [Rhizobiales bacterium 68-8]